jgi:hypothetical protein
MTVYAIRPNGSLEPIKRQVMGKMLNWVEFVDLR